MSATELIATHSNTDFDGFAAMVAAHKLYPEADMVLSGAVNRNVREFRTLFADEIPVVEAGAVALDRRPLPAVASGRVAHVRHEVGDGLAQHVDGLGAAHE